MSDDIGDMRRRAAEQMDGREEELQARRQDMNRRPWRIATDEEQDAILQGLGTYIDEYAGIERHRDLVALSERLIIRIERDGVILRPPTEED